MTKLGRYLTAATLAALLAACGPSAKSTNGGATAQGRGQLDIGYSLLYQEANGTPKLNLLLGLKEKSADFGKSLDAVMGTYKALAAEMEGLAKQHPILRIDVAPMSEIEGETRKAIGMDMAKDFAPLIGKSGIDFEREVLLMLYSELDEQRHLIGVLIERESDPRLKAFLDKTGHRITAQHRQVGALLDRKYFTH